MSLTEGPFRWIDEVEVEDGMVEWRFLRRRYLHPRWWIATVKIWWEARKYR